MNLLLGILIASVLLATAVSGATSFQLRSSDAAGNGLAQVFLVMSAGVLWLLIAAMMLVAATRPQPTAMPWGAIHFATALLFVFAAASQIAGLVALSQRSASGGFRLLLQLALIITPLLAAVHAAWRGLGASIPTSLATWGCALGVVVCSLIPWPSVMWPARDREPTTAADPLAAIDYPALLIHSSSSLRVIASAADLTHMHTNLVLSRTTDPILIDSHFKAFALVDLELAKSTLGLIARGPGIEPVTFRLLPYQPDGTAANILKILLSVHSFSADPARDAEVRKQLALQSTLPGMIEVIEQR